MNLVPYTMDPVEVSVSRMPTAYSEPIPQADIGAAKGFSLKDVPNTLLSMFGGGGGALSSALGMGAPNLTSQAIDFKANSSTSVQGAVKNSVAGSTSTIIQTGGNNTATVDQKSDGNAGNASDGLMSSLNGSKLAQMAVLVLLVMGALYLALRRK